MKYQEDGMLPEIVDVLIDYVNMDLSDLKYSGTSSPNVENGLQYVAYRIKAFLYKNTFAKRNAKDRTENSDQSEDYEGLHEYLHALYEADWIELDWRALNNYEFETIYEHEKEVKAYLGHMSYDFFNLLKKFKRLSQDSEEFKRDLKDVQDDLMGLFIEAFLYAIEKVDCNRTEKEMVKYINKAMLTKFIELQMKRDGVKRIRKGNESKYIKVKTDEDEDVWMLMIGKTLKNVGGLESFSLWLTPKQMKFMQDVHDIVKRSLKDNAVDNFRWGEGLKPVLKKRAIAEQLGMSETNFKQTLNRCKTKIYDNWKTVIDEKLK